MATFSYSFTFAAAATADGGNVQTNFNDARTFMLNSLVHTDGTNGPWARTIRVRRVAGQSCATGADTLISWDTEDEDPGGQVAVAFTTATVTQTGWYVVSAFGALAAQQPADVVLNVNGVAYRFPNSNVQFATPNIMGTALVYAPTINWTLSVGIRPYTSTGNFAGALNIYRWAIL